MATFRVLEFVPQPKQTLRPRDLYAGKPVRVSIDTSAEADHTEQGTEMSTLDI
jgi:hypothetical protein